MIFIEFEQNLTCNGLNIIKYRNVEDMVADWHYLYMDVETLHLLITHFGIISTMRLPAQPISKHISLQYCGAPINMYCGNNTQPTSRCLRTLDHNY